MPEIRLLDDRLVSKIAAGEVVERPASVVKELVENSLDAGAGDVRVELAAGGKRRIFVRDDGKGMGADDALLAFDRHATSKIADFDDLERVATLGFRGEALASIASVSRVELRTARDAGDGNLVRIEGGHVRKAEPISHPRGTSIEIGSLFFNVPARRKFLKQPATELRRCVEVMQGYALAHPGTRFSLMHEDRTLLETVPSASGDQDLEGPDIPGLKERITQVFGRELATKLHEIPTDFVGDEEAISGFVGDASTTRGRRLFLYVNRRLVRDRMLLARFYRSVRDVWRSEDFPALFLFLEVLPERVDVNVHPQKAEVRFRDLRFVDRVEEALRATLDLARAEGEAPLGTPRSLPDLPAAWEGLGGRQRVDGNVHHESDEVASTGREYDTNWRPGSPEAYAPPDRGAEVGPPLPAGSTIGSIARPTFEPIRRGDSPLAGRGKRLTPFRIVGQYKGSLILLEGHDGLYLVDQHAAHERLLYEQLRRGMAAQASASQRLLEPVLLELAPAEALRLQQLTPSLEHSGFEVRSMSGTTVALTSVPEGLSADRAERILHNLATAEDLGGSESAGDGDESGETTDDRSDETSAAVRWVRRRLLEEIAADMSCKAAIKIHRPLAQEEMETLISDLFACSQPYACPHGRPTVLHMSDTEMERRFGRRG
ncbi:MAG: DNA mismatch repair endonuclease MutL [Thermoanaerobaculia bacterium]|nr:DNA mismatch repair endonuclease MutL [Thermoanaerobaculia bacterium]